MAKLKRKYNKMRVEEESEFGADELTQKLEDIIDKQYRKNLNKLKGAPLSLWSHGADGSYKLKYYHSYREDMCDTMMTIGIEPGMERCRVYGFIHKPAAIWAWFWGVIASVFIDFLIISYCLLFVGGFDLTKGLMISGAVCLVRAYICASLLELDREKVKILRKELFAVIRTEPHGGERPDKGIGEDDGYGGSTDDADIYEVTDESEVRTDDERN